MFIWFEILAVWTHTHTFIAVPLVTLVTVTHPDRTPKPTTLVKTTEYYKIIFFILPKSKNSDNLAG